MSIRTRNVHRTSVMHPDVMGSPFCMPAADDNFFLAALAADNAAHAAAKYFTLLKTDIPGSPIGLLFTTSNNAYDSVLEVIGTNQFGDRVVEQVDMGASATTFWTTYAYKSVSSIQVISVDTSNSHTVKIGFTLVTPRIGLPFVPIKSTEVITTISPAGAEEAISSVNLATSVATTATWAEGGVGMIISSLSNYGLRP